MGRQIPIFAMKSDADNLIAFMREIAEIAIFVDFATTAEGLWVEAPDVDANPFFHVCNKRFPWTPEYGRVGERAYNPKHIGWYYVANRGAAPVVEFDCGTLSNGKWGRMYWSKYFSAPEGLAYDVVAFSEWDDKVLGWIRKRGKKGLGNNWGPYYLPVPRGPNSAALVRKCATSQHYTTRTR